MGRTALIALAATSVFLLAGCQGEPEKTKEEAAKEMFAPTDPNKLSPEMRANIPKDVLPENAGKSGQPPSLR